MLCLSRKVDEEIYIGDDTRVKVLGIRGGKVKLGIISDQRHRIDRGEVRERIEKERKDGR